MIRNPFRTELHRNPAFLLAAAAVFATGGILAGCQAQPLHVQTDESNVIVDVGPGITWDIKMNPPTDQIPGSSITDAEARCVNLYHGTFSVQPDGVWCLGIDY